MTVAHGPPAMCALEAVDTRVMGEDSAATWSHIRVRHWRLCSQSYTGCGTQISEGSILGHGIRLPATGTAPLLAELADEHGRATLLPASTSTFR